MSNFPYGGKDFSLLISLKQVFLVQKLQVDKWAYYRCVFANGRKSTLPAYFDYFEYKEIKTLN